MKGRIRNIVAICLIASFVLMTGPCGGYAQSYGQQVAEAQKAKL